MRNVSLLGGSQLGSWATTMAWTIIVPRRLGAAQMGVYTLGQAAAGVLLMVVGLGLRQFLVREIAADRSRAPHLLGTAIVLRGALCLPALLAAGLFVELGHLPFDQAAAVLLGWTMCVFFVASEPILAAFQAVERMRYLAYSTILTNTVVSLSTIALVMMGVQADGLILASVLTVALLTGLTFIWARGHFTIDLRVSPADAWRLLVESFPYSSTAAFFTLYLWIDSLMLSVMTPSQVLGWYGLPTRLFGSLMVAPVILSTAWLPQLVQAFQRGRQALLSCARPGIELILLLSMPISIGAVMVAKPLVTGLFGTGFSGSVPILALLALCVPPMYLNIMANQVMIAAKRQALWTRVMAVACVVNPLANLFLIPYYQRTQGNGAIGASVAMLLTETVLACISLTLVRHALNRHTLIRLAKGAIATAVMVAAVAPATRAGLIPSILTGIVAFPVASLALRVLTPEERAQLRRLLLRRSPT
jgi:O-antigen/teichoic acid export membrane protein